jgi:hypothetical protein
MSLPSRSFSEASKSSPPIVAPSAAAPSSGTASAARGSRAKTASAAAASPQPSVPAGANTTVPPVITSKSSNRLLSP